MERKENQVVRKKLLLQSMWIIFILDALFILFIEKSLKYYPIIFVFAGILLCYTLILKFIKKDSFFVWSSLALIYCYLFVLNYTDPYIVNFIFLLFPVIFSAVFQKMTYVVITGFVTICSQFYFFLGSYEIISTSFEKIDVMYYVFFAIIIVVTLCYYIKFINFLWGKVQRQNEIISQNLRTTEAKFDLIFSQSHDAIAIIEPDHTVRGVNPAFLKLYGWCEKEIVGSKYPYPSGGQSGVSSRSDKTKSGSSIEVEVTTTPLYSHENQLIAYCEMIRDVTEKKAEEVALFQQEKLKVAGQMAAGVAHEIRNPLTVIQGFLQMMDEKKEIIDPHYTKIMLEELKRMNSIVSEFLILSKPQAVHEKEINMRKLIDSMIRFFATESALKNVGIEFRCNGELPPVKGDENQLKQVLINLLKNAFDAMSEGGKIMVDANADNETVKIKISDQGPGIPADMISQVTKPFFTTKEKGTGLGLVITEKIIRQHKGNLTIISQKGKGTAVLITFPVSHSLKR
ncbi:ATP-binding protein [Metabacillus idriensis]|uniref:ATP-binding protein n=1 Tax=Metabacillus idriensis TaxID=324768 RepID=UPI002812D308|nr:ATP-binding protein [Metabacillus idriensis]MDR0137046.1 ATP-binding protein [Metabacillus idriensis]